MRGNRIVYAALLTALVATAQGDPQRRNREQPPPPAPGPEQAAAPAHHGPPPEEKTSVTHHSARVGGQQINYTATAGNYIIKSDDGTPKASFFFVAYTKDEVADVSKRPMSFVYNGGPGSGSLFTHMGLGPKRIVLTDDGHGMPAPYSIVDNESSFLDATDMVFVDAVSTGYSRPVPGENAAQFYGTVPDATWFSDFIYQYSDSQRALGLAQVSDRRKLRHHAVGADGQHFTAPSSDLSHWDRAGVHRCFCELGL